MFKEYHGCPMDWELEMTKSVREAKWFNYYDIKSINKQCALICVWLNYFFAKGLKIQEEEKVKAEDKARHERMIAAPKIMTATEAEKL